MTKPAQFKFQVGDLLEWVIELGTWDPFDGSSKRLLVVGLREDGFYETVVFNPTTHSVFGQWAVERRCRKLNKT